MIKVTDKRSSVFLNPAQEKRIMEGRAKNRWDSLPRYIKRAYKSTNKRYIEKAILRAINEGWTLEQLKSCVPATNKLGGRKAVTPPFKEVKEDGNTSD